MKRTFLKELPKEQYLGDKPSSAFHESEISPACKFFNHEDGKYTARTATTRSTKCSPRVKTSHLSSSMYEYSKRSELGDINKGDSVFSTAVWELSERIDSFNLRFSNKQAQTKNCEYFAYQVDIGYSCYQDIFKIMKVYYPEIASWINSYLESIFKLFYEMQEYIKYQEASSKKHFSILETRLKDLKSEYTSLNGKYQESTRLQKYDEEIIRNEVEKMFPENKEDLKEFKERMSIVKNIKSAGTSDALKELYLEMNRNRRMPDLSQIEFSSMNAENVIEGIKSSYEVLITSTIKTVSRALKGKYHKINVAVQTSAIYIEPKQYEDMVKQMEKFHLVRQSTMMQFDKAKDDIKSLNQQIDKLEIEKNNLRGDLLNAKRDYELKSKEFFSYRLEIESKKGEILTLQKGFLDRNREIENLEKKLSIYESELKKHKIKIDAASKSEPGVTYPAIFPRRQENFDNAIEKEKDKELVKSSGLDKITKSGMTVREEYEKMYADKLSMPSLNIRKSSEKIDKEPNEGLRAFKRRSTLVPQMKDDNESFNNSGLDIQDSVINEKVDESESELSEDMLKTHDIELQKNSHETSQDNIHLKKHSKHKSKHGKKPKKTHKSPKKNNQIEKTSNKKLTHPQIDLKKKLPSTGPSCKESTKTGHSIQESSIEHSITEQMANKLDKCCGKDITAEVSIGIQVGEESKYQEKDIAYTKLIHPFNPNNIYGLHGDVYYQNSSFVPQPKMPETVLPYKYPYIEDRP